MLRMPLIVRAHRRGSARPPCCARIGRARRRAAVPLLLPLALAALLPSPSRAAPGEAADPLADVVAEAFFLGDSLPPGGHELDLIVAGGPDEEGRMDVLPALQLGLRPSPWLGLATSIAVDPSSGGDEWRVHSPSGSVRALLRSPANGALGIATCVDVLGPGPGQRAEVSAGLGLIRAAGPLTLRAGTSVTTPVANWEPRLHAGLSAAAALGSRWRILGEAIVEVRGGVTTLFAGPTAKVALSKEVALAAGALLALRDPAAPPRFVLQLTRGL